MPQVWRQLLKVGTVLIEPPTPSAASSPSPVFDRFCIAFLAVDWIAFGSMHFSLHDKTLQMLPDRVPFPNAVIVGTGIAEVVVGVLMLYGRMRRIAAIGSLVLLVLLIPAVFQMLYDAEALPFQDPVLNFLWRLLLVPHNVLMAICSIHLLWKPYPDPWGTAKPEPTGDQSSLVGRHSATLLVASILLLCNAAGFLAVLLGVKGDLLTGVMWMMMCLALGGMIGFLFAVPRANTRVTSRDILEPNRNIEAISDWLTKILVGLGLVNFNKIGDFLGERSVILSRVLGVDPNYALALIIYFSVAGFLEGYLLTRMFLQWHFVDAIQSKAPLDQSTKRVQKS